jgi:hypothetical protein
MDSITLDLVTRARCEQLTRHREPFNDTARVQRMADLLAECANRLEKQARLFDIVVDAATTSTRVAFDSDERDEIAAALGRAADAYDDESRAADALLSTGERERLQRQASAARAHRLRFV